MAAPRPQDALRVTGQLEFDGTILGLTRDARFLPNIRTRDIHAEEWGNQTVETIYAGESSVLLAVLMSWDADMVGLVFPQGTIGSSTVNVNVRSGSRRPGAVLSVLKGGELRFVPRETSDPGVVIYRAVPMLQEAAELTMAVGETLGMGVVFRATPDSRSRTYDVGVGV